jgi:hypothetical protein
MHRIRNEIIINEGDELHREKPFDDIKRNVPLTSIQVKVVTI